MHMRTYGYIPDTYYSNINFLKLCLLILSDTWPMPNKVTVTRSSYFGPRVGTCLALDMLVTCKLNPSTAGQSRGTGQVLGLLEYVHITLGQM